MHKIWLALVCTLVLSPALTLAAPTYVTVLAGGKVAALPAPAFVGSDGQVYAPAEALHLLGAAYTVNGGAVTVTGANGQTLSLPFMRREGHNCVPLQKAALALGGDADWQPTTQTLSLRARLLVVRQDDGLLSIYTSYPVAYAAQSLSNPRRVYVDLYGADLAAVPASVPQVTYEDAPPSAALRIRSGQMDFNTVRITVDLATNMAFRVLSAGPSTSRVRVALGDPARLASLPAERNAPAPNVPTPPSVTLPPASVRPVPVAQTPPARPTPPRVVVNPPAPVLPAAPPVRITGVAVKNVSDTLVQITVAASGPAKYRTETLRGPNRLAFDLAGATLDAAVSPALPGSSPIVKAVRSGILHAEKGDFGRVVVDLASLVGYTVSSASGDNGAMLYTISLNLPRPSTQPAAAPPDTLGGANSIAGKIVVVDPGHGVQDTGAIAPDGTREKDINLAIGKKVRDVLTANGAVVYMTREDDSFLPVNARPQFAVARHADFFISVHCDDSVRGSNTLRGATVYFHANNPICRRMASDIVTRIAALSGLPSAGGQVRHDSVRGPVPDGLRRPARLAHACRAGGMRLPELGRRPGAAKRRRRAAVYRGRHCRRIARLRRRPRRAVSVICRTFPLGIVMRGVVFVPDISVGGTQARAISTLGILPGANTCRVQ